MSFHENLLPGAEELISSFYRVAGKRVMSQPICQLQCEIVKTILNRLLFVSTGEKLRKQLGITALGFF